MNALRAGNRLPVRVLGEMNVAVFDHCDSRLSCRFCSLRVWWRNSVTVDIGDQAKARACFFNNTMSGLCLSIDDLTVLPRLRANARRCPVSAGRSTVATPRLRLCLILDGGVHYSRLHAARGDRCWRARRGAATTIGLDIPARPQGCRQSPRSAKAGGTAAISLSIRSESTRSHPFSQAERPLLDGREQPRYGRYQAHCCPTVVGRKQYVRLSSGGMIADVQPSKVPVS